MYPERKKQIRNDKVPKMSLNKPNSLGELRASVPILVPILQIFVKPEMQL